MASNPWREADGRARRRKRTGGPVTDDTPDLVRGFGIDQERRGLRPNSILKRRYCLRLLAEAVHPIKGLLEVTREDIQMFLDGRQLVPRSRYAYISNFHSFFDWAVAEDLLVVDPTLRIARPRSPRHVPRPIPDHDLEHAIAVAPPRVKAMLALGAFQGLRAREIAGLQREDILEQNDPPVLIVAEGKGGHQRVLPLNEHALSALRVHGLPRHGYVFTRGSGTQRIFPHEVSAAVNSYLHDLGMAATCHQLRHWFATAVYRASRDLRVTQELLGHSSPTTTTIYVAYSAADAASAVRGLGPPKARRGASKAAQ